MLPIDDAELALDRQRLAAVRTARESHAARYFADQAARWDEVRSLYVDEAKVEAVLLEVFGDQTHDLLDIGTGTGRILQLFAPRIGFGLGIDTSREMLSVARANLDRTSLRNCQVRHGDMYHLPLPDGSFDAATLHNVLHFADDPGRRSPRRRGCCARAGAWRWSTSSTTSSSSSGASTPTGGSASPMPRFTLGFVRSG